MTVALTSLCTELLLPSWNSVCCRWWGIWYSTILKENVEWLLFRSLIINLGTSSKFTVSTHTLLPPEFLALLQQVKKCSRRFQLKSLVHWWADSSPIRLWTCLVGILLFTKAFFFFLKVDWWHGHYSNARSILTLSTPAFTFWAPETRASKSSSDRVNDKDLEEETAKCKKQFLPLAPPSTPTCYIDKLEEASCQLVIKSIQAAFLWAVSRSRTLDYL